MQNKNPGGGFWYFLTNYTNVCIFIILPRKFENLNFNLLHKIKKQCGSRRFGPTYSRKTARMLKFAMSAKIYPLCTVYRSGGGVPTSDPHKGTKWSILECVKIHSIFPVLYFFFRLFPYWTLYVQSVNHT